MVLQKNLIFLFSVFLLLTTSPLPLSAQQNLIDCYMIYTSSCPICLNKYNTYVKPFYDTYKDNETIDFFLIDISTDTALYESIIEALNINVSTLQGFPWVIFHWGDNQLIIIDDRNLELIEVTFLAILADSDYTSTKTSQSSTPKLLIESLDLQLLGISLLLVFGGLIFLGSPPIWHFYQNHSQKILKRISRKRFAIIIGSTLGSLITLTYQFLDRIRGGCGCVGGNFAQILLFRNHDHLTLLGIEIPIALMGIGFMSAIFITIIVISISPAPLSINLNKGKLLIITEKNLLLLYNLLVFLIISGFLSLFYLLYLELFLLKYFCLLCTVSQVVIVILTILIVTWKPFRDD